MSPGAAETILVVEDDPDLRGLVSRELADGGHRVRAVGSAEEAMDVLGEEDISLIVSDLRLPGQDGHELLLRTRGLDAPPAFLLMTGFGTIDQAVRSLQAGADDFLTKPLDLDHLMVRVDRILEHRRMSEEVRRYREVFDAEDVHGMVGRSASMQTLFRELEQVALGRGAVLLEGESGVGKELAARAIHASSERADGPFVAVNCAGIPASLLESEFFGHRKGAFTGATERRKGLFEAASGGTLLLDEVGEMPVEVQAKLLRVLQEGVVRPVGGDEPHPVDVRVVAATHRDLEADRAEGRFRDDLYFRLETFRIRIPPLRERDGDLELLTTRFVRRHAARLGRRVPEPTPAFRQALRRYSFPGNVRELESLVERAVTFATEGVLELQHLPERLRADGGGPAHPVPMEAKRGGGGAGEGTNRLDALLDGDHLPPLRELERRYVRLVLDHVGGNKRRAAALLGVSRRTLYRRLDEGPQGE